MSINFLPMEEIVVQCPACMQETTISVFPGSTWQNWACNHCTPPLHHTFRRRSPPQAGADKPDAQQAISDVCDEIKAMLLEKNRKYGNSALAPKRIFSKADPVEQINVRLDDKLSRIASRQSDDDEDPEWDILGYLILKRVAIKLKGGVSEA